MSKTTTNTVCPKCGQATGVPIVYGLPGAELFASAERGEVALGGCLIMPDNPHRRCTDAACRHAW